jgi:hypothetical protein
MLINKFNDVLQNMMMDMKLQALIYECTGNRTMVLQIRN